ncbi:hypothetical protein CBS101457_002403 [Exobasidium rhododendri]|nr:hypothetical protein CBS101457_002403 [Exobasidium rhododendri]
MTCDEGRPCKRCVKRDIGHMCHDESTSKMSQGQSSQQRMSPASSSSVKSKAQSPVRVIGRLPTTSATANTSSPVVNAPSAFLRHGDGSLMTLHSASMSNSPNLALKFDATTQNSFNDMNWGGTSVLGGAGFLGLGGGSIAGLDSDVAASGDAAGGSEFNILSEYLESLDGGVIPTTGEFGSTSANNGNTNYDATVQSSPSQPSNQVLSMNEMQGTTTETDFAWSNPAESSGWPLQSTNHTLIANALGINNKSRRNSSIDIPMTATSSAIGGLNLNSKTEKFFLTAADQKDGTRDERLGRVIQAKYDAGILRPYNHVNGYARLNRWMEQNASQTSRRRILKPLSIFRPAFRAVAQSLTNLDLVYIEEAFERLLLDYDRVFSTQGIPACLWRRTGEIYKGNKEFAELVGVGIEALRDGRCAIYELMQEESAVNYWEKYGAVSFDPGQKAVLTSCVLKTKGKGSRRGNGAIDKEGKFKGGAQTKGEVDGLLASNKEGGEEEDGFVSCCFSFTIRRDAWSIPCLIVGNFLPLQGSNTVAKGESGG